MASDSELNDFYAIAFGCIHIELLAILTWNSKFETQRHIFSNFLFRNPYFYILLKSAVILHY